ncbi:hypothetical protein [Maritimibacter sp. 55A14]|uniref:hypothetical protein n=1 Tax=Maritimibacter sp. 55A14 TaxID=2174844 RepID=UPI0013048EED|nr:hypothetical protein [Maritimibacter sp. 55A14]
MNATKSSLAIRALAILALLGLAACGDPIDPDNVARVDEIPPGSGLLTKEEGAFVKEF